MIKLLHLAGALAEFRVAARATHLLSCITAVANHAALARCLLALTLVRSAVENEIITGNILVSEVEHQCRIQRHTAQTGLEMQVGACASACIAAQANRLSGTYFLILRNELFAQVAVDGLKTITMTDDDIFAITASLITHNAHLATESSADGIANIDFDVQTFVLASPTGTITEITCHHTAWSGHTKTAQVNPIGFGKFGCAVCIFIIPAFIKIG